MAMAGESDPTALNRTKPHQTAPKINFWRFSGAGWSGHAPPGQPRTGRGTKSKCQRTVTHAARKTPPAAGKAAPETPSAGSRLT